MYCARKQFIWTVSKKSSIESKQLLGIEWTFDGTLKLEHSMTSGNPPSTVRYTQRENNPVIVDEEPQLERDDHDRHPSNIRHHSVGIFRSTMEAQL